jgi:hypothetical protein
VEEHVGIKQAHGDPVTVKGNRPSLGWPSWATTRQTTV